MEIGSQAVEVSRKNAQIVFSFLGMMVQLSGCRLTCPEMTIFKVFDIWKDDNSVRLPDEVLQ